MTKCIRDRVDNINDEIEKLELEIIKLAKDIEYIQAVIETKKRKKVKLLKNFN